MGEARFILGVRRTQACMVNMKMVNAALTTTKKQNYVLGRKARQLGHSNLIRIH